MSTSTRFWQNLIKGNKVEEQIAQWYEKQDYRVERIGPYRLPIDLLVWNEKEEFGVQVKYRSGSLVDNIALYLKETEIWAFYKIMREDKLRIVLTVTNGEEVKTIEFYCKGVTP